MEDMIRKSAVMNRLMLMKTQTEMNQKVPVTRRRAVLGIIDDMFEMVNEISAEEDLELVDNRPEPALPDDVNEDTDVEQKPEKPKVPIDCILEPIMVGSNIGIERYRCRKCRTAVERNDRFCRRCGSTFGEIVKKNNTRWDTVKHRPAGREAG